MLNLPFSSVHLLIVFVFHSSGSSFDKCPFLVDSGLKIKKPGEEILKDIVVEKANQGTYQVSDSKPTSEG